MNHSYSIRNKNVILRALEKNDIEKLREWRNEKKNSKFLRQIPYITENAQKRWFENYLKNEDEICFAIEECEQLNRMVGSLSLYNFNGDTAEFGKILIGDKEAHGKRIGFNATYAALKIAFEVLKLKRVVLEVYEDNLAARTIYEQIGFLFKGVLRKDKIGKAFLYEVYSIEKEI